MARIRDDIKESIPGFKEIKIALGQLVLIPVSFVLSILSPNQALIAHKHAAWAGIFVGLTTRWRVGFATTFALSSLITALASNIGLSTKYIVSAIENKIAEDG